MSARLKMAALGFPILWRSCPLPSQPAPRSSPSPPSRRFPGHPPHPPRPPYAGPHPRALSAPCRPLPSQRAPRSSSSPRSCSFCGHLPDHRGPLYEGPHDLALCANCASVALSVINLERQRELTLGVHASPPDTQAHTSHFHTTPPFD